MLSSPIITKSDITSSTPRVSLGTDERKHTDFSERDTWGQQSYHHGYGAIEVSDPYTFHDSENVVTWIKDQLILSPANVTATKTTGGSSDLNGYVADQLVFEGNIYQLVYGTLPADNALYLYNNTTDSLDTVAAGLDTTTGEPFQLIQYGGNMYVCQGESVSARAFDGSTWSNLNTPLKFAASFDGFLWRADNIFELYYSNDPENGITATWQGPIEVGDRSYPIRGMVAGFDGALWVGKDDGIYSVRKITEVNYAATKVIDLTNGIQDTNGAAMIVWGSNLYISAGNTVIRWDGSSITFMGPERGAHTTQSTFLDNTAFGQPIIPSNVNLLPPTYQAGVTGTIRKFAHDNNFLYAAVDNDDGATSRVMVWTGTGWHTVHKSSSRIHSVFYSRPLAASDTLSFPHLWWSEGDTYRLQKRARYSHNPLDDNSIDFVSTGHLITGWFDARLVDIDKTFFDFVTNTTRLSATGNTVTVEFQVDDYDVWYTLGTCYRTPESTLYFPDNDLLDPAIFARKIRYRITLNRDPDDTTTTPIMKSWGHRFVVRPESRYGWNITVKAYNEFDDLRRRRNDNKASEIRKFLYGLRDKKTPIQFFDSTELESLTNVVLNPSCEIDSDGDGFADGITAIGTGVTGSLTAQFKSSGVLSQKIVLAAGIGEKGILIGTAYDVVEGQSVFAAMDVFNASGNTLTMEVLDETDEVVESQQVFISNITDKAVRFQRYNVFFTAESSGAYKFRLVRRSEEGANDCVFYVDKLEFIADNDALFTEYNGDYIDGDQLRCRWNGIPHASTSTRQNGYFVYITTFTESLRYLENKSATSDYSSDILLNIREMQ